MDPVGLHVRDPTLTFRIYGLVQRNALSTRAVLVNGWVVVVWRGLASRRSLRTRVKASVSCVEARLSLIPRPVCWCSGRRPPKSLRRRFGPLPRSSQPFGAAWNPGARWFGGTSQGAAPLVLDLLSRKIGFQGPVGDRSGSSAGASLMGTIESCLWGSRPSFDILTKPACAAVLYAAGMQSTIRNPVLKPFGPENNERL